MRSALLREVTASKRRFPTNGFPEIIRAKHKLRILWDLRDGATRFGEIRRRLGHAGADTKLVAARVLSRELRSLVELGLINRRAYNEIPPRVEYRLTALGRSLLPVIAKILDWGTRHPACIGLNKEASPNTTSKEKDQRAPLHLEDPKKPLAGRQTESEDAHREYLKGRFYWNQVTAASLRKAIKYFEQAINREPSYALAFARLSDAYALLAFFNFAPPLKVLPKAKQAALRALELDAGLAEAHTSLAGVKKAYDWDWGGAEFEYRRALELNPDHPEAHRGYADFLSAIGRHQQALRENRKAQELDPLSCATSMEGAWNLYMAREYKAAQQQALKTLQMEPNFGPGYYVLALAYERMGRGKEAIAAFEKARAISGSNPATIAGLGHALTATGQKAKPKALLEELRAILRRRYVSPYCFALVHAGLGEKEQAFQRLEEAVVTHDVWLVWLKAEPRFDNLRSDSRFQVLLRRIGLTA